MRWRVSRAEIINRIDQAAAHQVEPDAVDLRAGKERVLGTREPGGEFFKAIFVRARGEGRGNAGTEEAGAGGLAGADIGYLAGAGEENDLLAVEFVGVEVVAPVVLEDL